MSKTVKPSVRRHISRDVFTFKAVGYPLIFLFALVCLIPFLIVIGSSLTSENYIIRNGYSIIPKELSLESYKTIFQSPMAILRAYGVTIFVHPGWYGTERIFEYNGRLRTAEKRF